MAVEIVALSPAAEADIVVDEAAPAAVEVFVFGHLRLVSASAGCHAM
jgi:hypothetical protein